MKERKPISRREVNGDFRLDFHKRENGLDCIMRAYKRYGCALKKYWFLSGKAQRDENRLMVRNNESLRRQRNEARTGIDV